MQPERHRRTSDPTPQEIAEACRQVRATWTPQTVRVRSGLTDQRWTPPLVACAALELGLNPRD